MNVGVIVGVRVGVGVGVGLCADARKTIFAIWARVAGLPGRK